MLFNVYPINIHQTTYFWAELGLCWVIHIIMFTKPLVIILLSLPVIDLGMGIGQCDIKGSQLRGFWECLGHNSYSSFENESGRDSRTAAVILQPERKLSWTQRGRAITRKEARKAFMGLVSSWINQPSSYSAPGLTMLQGI